MHIDTFHSSHFTNCQTENGLCKGKDVILVNIVDTIWFCMQLELELFLMFLNA